MKRLLAVLLLAAPLLAQTPTPTPTRTPTRTPTPAPAIPSRYSLATQVRPGFGTFSTESTVNLLGDTYYAMDSRTFGRVAGNTTAVKNFWCQTGTGSVSAAPVWCLLASGDIPNNAANTTGSAAKWTTARNLAGNSVDGSAAVAFSNKFVVQGTADAGLSGPQFLGALGTGILKNTITTGVLSIAAASDFPVMVASGASHAAGMAPDPGAAAGTTKFLREDATYAVPAGGAGGTVTSITVSAPLTGGTITTTGTIGCPAAVASGASHAPGCVPDPGVTPGTAKYLREDMTYVTPAGAGGVASINADTTSAQVIAAGSGISVATVTGTTTITATGGGGGGTVATKGDIQTYSTTAANLAVGTNGQVVTANSTAATGLKYAGGFVQIAKITTAASQATVDFTSIPANYTDLMVVWEARSNVSANSESLSLKVNNDGTAANYVGTYLGGNGSSAYTGALSTSTSGIGIGGVTGASSSANYAAAGKILVTNYAGTTFYKNVEMLYRYQAGTYTDNEFNTGFWKSTAAITRLTFTVPTSFVNGSVFTLYGMGTP